MKSKKIILFNVVQYDEILYYSWRVIQLGGY
jgi:hypothetical protein